MVWFLFLKFYYIFVQLLVCCILNLLELELIFIVLCELISHPSPVESQYVFHLCLDHKYKLLPPSIQDHLKLG